MSDGHFARNVKWQFVANGAQALLGGVYLIVLGRLLGARDFGIFSVVSALVSVAGLLCEVRLQDVVARDFYEINSSEHKEDGVKIIDFFVLEVLSRALPCLGLVALSGTFAAAESLPTNTGVLIVIAAFGFFFTKSGWGVSTGILRVLGRTDLIASCLAADWGLRLMATLCYAIVSDLSIKAVLVIALLIGGACNLFQLLIATREFKARVAILSPNDWSIAAALVRLRSNRRLIGANFGVSVSDLMTKDLDIAMISGLLSADKVGLYKLAKSFAQMIWRAIDPFYLAIMPEIQRLRMLGNEKALKTLLHKTSVRLLVLSMIFICVAYVAVRLFGRAILGMGYPGLPSLMLAMSLWIIVCAPLVWAHPLSVAINRPELAVIGGVLGSLVGVATFWALTPALGVWGATIAWSISTTVTFVFTAVSSAHLSRLF